MSTLTSIADSSVTEVEMLRARLEEAENELEAIKNATKTESNSPRQSSDDSLVMLNAIMNAVPHPVFWKDRNSVFRGCNAMFAHEIGYKPEDMIGTTDADLNTETLNRHTHEQDVQVIKSGNAIVDPLPAGTMQDGQKKLESVSKVPLHDPDGNAIGMLGTFLDITAQKLAEQQLRASEKRFSAAFEHSASGMALVAVSDGTWIRVNKVVCDMLGYTQKEFECKTIYDMTHVDDIQVSEKSVQSLLSGKKPSNCFEKRFIHKNGETIWTQVSVAMIRDEQDKTGYLVSQIHNITARKKSEAELGKMHRRLLEYARESGMAEVAISVLHNVGNVLNSISVSSSLAAEKIRGSQIGGLAQAVELMDEHKDDFAEFLTKDQKGRRLPGYLGKLSSYLVEERQEIVDELEFLDYNIQHVKQVISMQQSYTGVAGVTEEMDICELGEDSIRLNIRSLEREGIRVESDFGSVPPVYVEKHKVMQILVNLIQNAKSAFSESEQTTKMITLKVAGDQHRVRLSVIDNAIGIEPDVQSQLFDFGFTTKNDGIGVGLHSSALAAKEMGGSLSAFSEGLGHGAIFTLELPCVTEGDMM